MGGRGSGRRKKWNPSKRENAKEFEPKDPEPPASAGTVKFKPLSKKSERILREIAEEKTFEMRRQLRWTRKQYGKIVKCALVFGIFIGLFLGIFIGGGVL